MSRGSAARYLQTKKVPAGRKCRYVDPYLAMYYPPRLASAFSAPSALSKNTPQLCNTSPSRYGIWLSATRHVSMCLADSRPNWRPIGHMHERGGEASGGGGGRHPGYTCSSPKRFNANPALRRVLPHFRTVL